MENKCKKCEGLHAAFDYDGRVEVVDRSGVFLRAPEFYNKDIPFTWPTCPDCRGSLDLPAEDDVRQTGGVTRNYGLPLAFLLGACFWAAVWYFFLR